MSPLLTIRKLHALHKTQCPDSALTEFAVRKAVKDGALPSIQSGKKSLVRLDIFEAWTRGEL